LKPSHPCQPTSRQLVALGVPRRWLLLSQPQAGMTARLMQVLQKNDSFPNNFKAQGLQPALVLLQSHRAGKRYRGGGGPWVESCESVN
jgi:hypothetical protein